MRIKKEKIFLLIAILIFTFAFSGCYDLGDGIETDDEYRANYSLIRLVDSDSETYDYSMADFYTDEAVNDLISPLSEEERREYAYIFIKSKKTLFIGEIAIYFDSTVEADVNVKVFVMDEENLPTKLYTGKDGKYSADKCDEPDLADSVADVSFRVPGKADKWKEFYLTSWKEKDEQPTKRHLLGEGQYLVFRISNNCYDPAKRIFEEAEEIWQKALEAFEEARAGYEEIMSDSSLSAEDKAAAQTDFNKATSIRNAAERDYNAAREKYEKEKGPDYTRVPIRITAILISAQ